jgi:hypothetical protein
MLMASAGCAVGGGEREEEDGGIGVSPVGGLPVRSRAHRCHSDLGLDGRRCGLGGVDVGLEDAEGFARCAAWSTACGGHRLNANAGRLAIAF